MAGYFFSNTTIVKNGLLNGKLEEEAWQQCTLPASKGGLGIRLPTDLDLPAFLSSAFGAAQGAATLLPEKLLEAEYQPLVEAKNLWKEEIPDETLQPSDKTVQAHWDAPLFTKKFDNLLEGMIQPADKARLRAVASDHASDWLNAIPVASLGLKLDNTSLRIACGLRLGSPICHPHTCLCGEWVNQLGRHGLSCTLAKGTSSRHAHANDIIRRAMGSAQVPAVKEPPGLVRSDMKQPDGLTLFPWSNGRCLVWDFTCWDTLCKSYVSETSEEAGKAAVKAEDRKLDKYSELSDNYTVMPVATETMGSWGKMGLKFIQDLGSRIAEVSGEKKSATFLFQSLSMAIQRGNVASALGTVPKMKELHEIYEL